MALNWPGIQDHGSDLDSEDERELKSLLDESGDAVAEGRCEPVAIDLGVGSPNT